MKDFAHVQHAFVMLLTATAAVGTWMLGGWVHAGGLILKAVAVCVGGLIILWLPFRRHEEQLKAHALDKKIWENGQAALAAKCADLTQQILAIGDDKAAKAKNEEDRA